MAIIYKSHAIGMLKKSRLNAIGMLFFLKLHSIGMLKACHRHVEYLFSKGINILKILFKNKNRENQNSRFFSVIYVSVKNTRKTQIFHFFDLFNGYFLVKKTNF
jgi:hypothetical protein